MFSSTLRLVCQVVFPQHRNQQRGWSRKRKDFGKKRLQHHLQSSSLLRGDTGSHVKKFSAPAQTVLAGLSKPCRCCRRMLPSSRRLLSAVQ
eukprot:1901301-Amphidinium_carterae.1